MSFFTKFFVLLLISFPLFASSGSIKGKVTDKATSEALIGANVVIQSLQIGAATDTDGLYQINNIPAGTYTVKASYVGYKPVEQKDVVVKNFQVVELNFELDADFTLAECIVVCERPILNMNSTNSCKIISSEEIKNLPVKGINNLTSLQGGVVVDNSTINVRGGRGGEVLYMIDGVLKKLQAMKVATVTLDQTQRNMNKLMKMFLKNHLKLHFQLLQLMLMQLLTQMLEDSYLQCKFHQKMQCV